MVKERFEGVPVGSGTILQNPKSTPNTPLEVGHPGPAELSPDQSTQTQYLGIGNVLTEGTSNGYDGEREDNNGGLEQTQKKDEEPWKLILGRKRVNPQNRSPATPQDTVAGPTTSQEPSHTAKTTQAEPDRRHGPMPAPAPPQESTPRPTYNRFRLAIRGEGDITATPRAEHMPSTNYFNNAAPTGDSYAKCLGKSFAPLGTTRGARIMAIKSEYEKRHPPGTTPAEASRGTSEENK